MSYKPVIICVLVQWLYPYPFLFQEDGKCLVIEVFEIDIQMNHVDLSLLWTDL